MSGSSGCCSGSVCTLGSLVVAGGASFFVGVWFLSVSIRFLDSGVGGDSVVARRCILLRRYVAFPVSTR